MIWREPVGMFIGYKKRKFKCFGPIFEDVRALFVGG